MLLIRPTKKVLNISRINPGTEEIAGQDPVKMNEWFVDIVGLGKPGKNALIFMHRTTYLMVLVPGRSLEKAIPVFKSRLEKLLRRLLIPDDIISGISNDMDPVVISKTNDRKTLGIINNYKAEINVTFRIRFDADDFDDWDFMEDIYTDYPFKSHKGKMYSNSVKELYDMFGLKGTAPRLH